MVPVRKASFAQEEEKKKRREVAEAGKKEGKGESEETNQERVCFWAFWKRKRKKPTVLG